MTRKGTIKSSLRFSFLDGLFASGMTGFTQDYFTPFLLFLGGGAREVGLLTSLPNVVASLVQLKTADLVTLLGSRKRTITHSVLLQALMILLVAALVHTGAPSIGPFIALVVLFTSFGAVSTPAWGSLMADLVPEHRRGAYFGWRNSVLGVVIVATSLLAGLLLHYTGKGRLAMAFTALFAAAFLVRIISWYFLTRMHDPGFTLSQAPRVTARGFLAKLRGSNFARFTLFVSLMSFSVNIAAPYFAVLMIRDMRFGYLRYAAITITATLVMYLLMGRWGKLADSVGNVRVLRFTAPIIALVPLLWVVYRHPLYLAATQVVSGFAWAGFNLCASNFIYDAVAPEKRVRYIAYFNVINGVSLSAGALLGGFLAPLLPPLFGFSILTLFVVSSAIRIPVSLLLPAGLREVRTVRSIGSDRLFFGMIGVGPLLGVDRKTIRYLR